MAILKGHKGINEGEERVWLGKTRSGSGGLSECALFIRLVLLWAVEVVGLGLYCSMD